MSKIKIIGGAGLIAAIVFVSFYTSHRYGFTWDEPWDLYFAKRNLNYAMTLDPNWINFDLKVDFSREGSHPNFYFPEPIPYRTLNFGPMMASITCDIFYERLHILDAIDSYHLANKLMFAALLISVFLFLRRELGYIEAVAGIIAIAFQPRFWADMQFNLKDFPYACFMAFTIFAFRRAILNSSSRRMIFAAILMGLSAAIKPNAALLAIIIPAWYAAARSSIANPEGRRKIYFYASIAAAPIIATAAYIAAWPYLWNDTVGRFSNFIKYYMAHGAKGPDYFQWDKLYLFITVQPPALLLLASAGIICSIINIKRGIKRELYILLLLWLCLPVLRVLPPKVYDYDGVRHFIEYAVPLGILGGIGFGFIVSRSYEMLIERASPKTAVAAAILLTAIPAASCLYSSLKVHPNEIAYFNFLVGGLKGAQARWPDATDYWGSSFRQGINWLNENAEIDSLVIVPIGQHIVGAVEPVWMRGDLVFYKRKLAEFLPTKEFEAMMSEISQSDYSARPLYIVYITNKSLYKNYLYYIEKYSIPSYSIRVDDAPILNIYRFDSVSAFIDQFRENKNPANNSAK